jgi:hypothetical protein
VRKGTQTVLVVRGSRSGDGGDRYLTDTGTDTYNRPGAKKGKKRVKNRSSEGHEAQNGGIEVHDMSMRSSGRI